MAKEEGIIVEGKVLNAYPNALFDVELGNGVIVKGHVSGNMRKHFIKVLPDDTVQIELSPYDLTRGRIIQRGEFKKKQK